MSTVLCDLGAWITYASRAPLTPIPKEEADRVLREATGTARQARAVQAEPWYREMEAFGRATVDLPDSQPLPVHLMAAPGSDRTPRSCAAAHRVPSLDLSGPFLLEVCGSSVLGEPAYVVAPAPYLLLRAGTLGVAGTAALGCAMAADYVKDPALDECFERRPLVTLNELERICSEAPRSQKGRAVLAEALGAISEHARSPMETTLAALLALPPKHGGMGLPKPRLNHHIP